MRIGFIGAGRVGCSVGKYLSIHGVDVSGYYSRSDDSAQWAAEFTGGLAYGNMKDCVDASDIIFLAVPDDAIEEVWHEVRSSKLMDKVICHFSGMCTSEVFANIGIENAHGASLHPMFAFDSRERAYKQLEGVGFTVEGDEEAVRALRELLEPIGTPVLEIDRKQKAKYHAAASILSNHVAAVLECGYQLLESAGFDEAKARAFSKALVLGNVGHVVDSGAVAALTGPIERGDIGTVQQHLQVLDAEQEEMYRFLGRRLIGLAAQKNPDTDYTSMQKLLK